MNFFRKWFHKKHKKIEEDGLKETASDSADEKNHFAFLTQFEKTIPTFFSGNVTNSVFFDELVNVNFLVPCVNDEMTQPLIMIRRDNEPHVVFLTAFERMNYIKSELINVKGAVELNLAQYINSIPEAVAIVINPGWPYEIMLSKDIVFELKKCIKIDS